MTPRQKEMLQNLAEGRPVGYVRKLNGDGYRPSSRKGGATWRAIDKLQEEGLIDYVPGSGGDRYELTEKGKAALVPAPKKDMDRLTLELVDKLTSGGNRMGANSKTMTRSFWLKAGSLMKAGLLDRRHMGLNRMYYVLTESGFYRLQAYRGEDMLLEVEKSVV